MTPLRPLLEALFARDASGRGWVSALLAAAPSGRDRLGELVDQPGWLDTLLAVHGASGALACFEYPVTAPRALERWYIDHPDRLTWAGGIVGGDDGEGTAPADRLRRALVRDEPPGARARAQDRARELLGVRSALAREWWRFEEPAQLDCLLTTNRLVVTIAAPAAGLPPATPWFPPRSQLVRDLEAARQTAAGRRFATLLISDEIRVTDAELAASLPAAAPHLDAASRQELADGYLGTLTWAAAAAAVAAFLPGTGSGRVA